MDNWTLILLEAEDMWEQNPYSHYLYQIGCDHQKYQIERDTFKAGRILALYGYDYFLRFVERCPHIQEMIKEYKPCDQNSDQCTLFCTYCKEGGCKLYQ